MVNRTHLSDSSCDKLLSSLSIPVSASVTIDRATLLYLIRKAYLVGRDSDIMKTEHKYPTHQP